MSLRRLGIDHQLRLVVSLVTLMAALALSVFGWLEPPKMQSMQDTDSQTANTDRGRSL